MRIERNIIYWSSKPERPVTGVCNAVSNIKGKDQRRSSEHTKVIHKLGDKK